MQIMINNLIGLEIISLQTGQVVAIAENPIVKPDNLEVIGFHCRPRERASRADALLLKDVRQVARDCMVIDSELELIESGDIVRLKTIIEQGFQVTGASVVSESGQFLGRVSNYSINLDNSFVQKLYVKQPFIKNLLWNELMIDREQIVDINGRQITVRDAGVSERLPAGHPAIK